MKVSNNFLPLILALVWMGAGLTGDLYSQANCPACMTLPAPFPECSPTLPHQVDITVSADGTWGVGSLAALGDPDNVTQRIRIVGTTGSEIVTVNNKDLLLKSAGAQLVVENCILRVNNGNLKLEVADARVVFSDMTLQLKGDFVQKPGTVVCITSSMLEIGDEEADGMFFNTGGSSTTASFENDGGKRFLQNVTMNVTMSLFNTSTSGTEDIFINVCAEIGDRGPVQSFETPYGNDGNDSGTLTNNGSMKFYNCEFIVPAGNLNDDAGTMEVCNTDFVIFNSGNFNRAASATLQGCEFILWVGGSGQINLNGTPASLGVEAWRGTIGSGAWPGGTPPESSEADIMANFFDCSGATIDIRLDKQVSDATPFVNTNVTFSLVLTNDGPATATNIDVKDVLPDGYTYVANSIMGGDANDDSDPAGTGLTWTVNSLASGNSVNLTYDVVVNPTGNYLNFSEVTDHTEQDSDSTPGNDGGAQTMDEDDEAVLSVFPIPIVDVSLDKQVSNATPPVSTTVTFTLVVSNDGPNEASNIDVNDVLPSGYTYVANSITGGDLNDDSSPAGTGLTWMINSLPVGNSVNLTYDAVVNLSGTYLNYAEITAHDELDSDSAPGNDAGAQTPDEDDESEVSVSPVPLVDVNLDKQVSDATPLVGSTVTFTLVVANDGPSTASNIDVTDVLPSGYTYVANSIVGGNANDDTDPAGTGLTWTINSLASGASVNLTYQAMVNVSGAYLNYAEVTDHDELDSDSAPGNDAGAQTPDEDDEAEVQVNPIPVVDVRLDKQVSNATPLVGSTVTFTLVVANDGPSTATNIDVADVLPSGYAYVANSIMGGDADDDTDPSGTGLTWTINSLASGASVNLTYDAVVNASGAYLNYAEVTDHDEQDSDSTPGNDAGAQTPNEDDEAEVSVSPIPVVDISLDKQVSNATPLVGSTVTFTLVVANDGPSTASNIDVTDVLPSGYTYVANSIMGGDADDDTDPSGTGLTWTINSLASGASVNLTYDAMVNASGVYLNYAEVTDHDEQDSDSTPGNGPQTPDEDDEAEVSVSPIPVIDVSLDKQVSDATPLVGSTVTFTLVVANDGPSTATNIDVADVLPSGYTYVANSIMGGNTNDDTDPAGSGLTWTINSLASGGSVNLTYQAMVNVAGDYLNYAEVTGHDEQDSNSTPGNGPQTPKENDEDEVSVNPIPVIDISLDKQVSNATPLVGSTVTFTLVVANDGPSTATNIDVTDVLPSGYTYVANSIMGGDTNDDTSPAGTGLTWTINSLASGGSVNLTYDAVVNPAGEYVNYAQVTDHDEQDSDSTPGNDTGAQTPNEDDEAEVSVVPIPLVDVSLDKQVSDATPLVGSTVTFTLVVANDGPSTATNIDVTDMLPTGFTYVAFSILGGDANDDTDPAGTGLMWTISSLAPGASLNLTYEAQVNASGSYVNYAEVTDHDGQDSDSAPGNDGGAQTPDEDDEAEVSVDPIPVVDINLDKQASTTTPFVGDLMAFTLLVTNDGPSTANNIDITDVLPSGLLYLANSITGGDANDDTSPAGTGLTWTINTLPAGATANLTYLAVVNNTGSYSNFAEVTAQDELDDDSTPGNDGGAETPDEDDEDLEIVVPKPMMMSPPVGLEVQGPATAACGDTIVFDIVVQTGFIDLFSFQYSLNWDPAELQYLADQSGLTPLTIDGSDPLIGLVPAVTPSTIIYTWGSMDGTPDNLPDGTVIFQIRMKVLNNIGSVDLNITGNPVFLEAIQAPFFQNIGITPSNWTIPTIGSGVTAYNTSISACESASNPNTGAFMLSDADSEVYHGNASGDPVPTDFEVSYHASLQDAQNDQNALNKVVPFIAPSSNVWARLENTTTGCFAISIIQLNVLDGPDVAAIVTNESCAGSGDGSITANITSNTSSGPWNYTWYAPAVEAPGNIIAQTLASPDKFNKIENLDPGAYLLVVEDADGCTNNLLASVLDGPNVAITPLPDITVCPGADVEAIELSAQPLALPLEYSWSGGAPANLIDGNANGADPEIPGFTASLVEQVVTVTVTATFTTSTGVCDDDEQFTLTILDINDPQFLNCPDDIVVLNDVDTCGAFVHWDSLIALDDCDGLPLTVNQTAGSANGSFFPVSNVPETIQYEAEDSGGNLITCEFTIMVIDGQAPEIVCPASMVLNTATGTCSTTVADIAPLYANDNCPGAQIAYTLAGATTGSGTVDASGNAFNKGFTKVTYTITDAANHARTCQFSVTVEDNEKPVLDCSNIDPVRSNDVDECSYTVQGTEFDPASFTDNCPMVTLVNDYNFTATLAGETFPVGVTEVTWTATDMSGNTATCRVLYTINDTQLPTIACPADATVEINNNSIDVTGGPLTVVSSGSCGVTLSYTQPLGSDNCPNWEIDLLSGLGASPNFYEYGGTYTNYYRVTDASGNTATCSFTVTVEDAVPPVITCPEDLTVGTDDGECDAQVVYTNPLSSDNCQGYTTTLVSGPASGAEFALGTTTVVFQVTDPAGNVTTCDFTVTVSDDESPTIVVCPADRLVNTSSNGTGDCSASVPDLVPEVVATDNCTASADLVITQDPTAASTFSGAHGDELVVTITVKDAADNTSTCEVVLTLNDDEDPTIDCNVPTALSTTTGECGYVVTDNSLNPSFDDNCSATRRHNYLAAPQLNTLEGAVLPVGATTIVWRITDEAGNRVTCEITYTVTDDENPVFVNCPADTITVGNDVDKCGANVFWLAPSATDNCAAEVTQEDGLLPGSLFPVGNSTIEYLATDAEGNTALCVFTITVTDMQTPTAVCQDVVVDLNADGEATITASMLDGGSTDNCPASLTLAASATDFDCSNVSENNVTLTVTDGAGNESVCVAEVTVRDVTAPAFTCPAPVSVSNCNDVVPDLLSGITDESDNCTAVTMNQSLPAGTAFGHVNGGTVNITITATDAHGNESSCIVPVTIADDTDPVVVCPADITVGNDVDKCGANVTYSIPTVTDDCPGVTLALSDGLLSGDFFPVGETTVEYTGTDAAGNQSTCAFTVEVTDMQTPTAVCQDVVVDLNADGEVTITAAMLDGGTTDNCPASLTLAASVTDFDCSNVGENNVTLTVTDGAGNESVCVSEVTVRDVTAPVFDCPDAVTVASCNDLVPDVIDGLVATDACGVASITQDPAAGLDFGAQSGNGVVITVTVTDVNGNASTCEVGVTIDDSTVPVFVNCPTQMVMIGNDPDQCSGKVNWSIPVAYDDCLQMPVSAPGAPVPGTITQIGGPLSGTVVAITCPATPQTVTYQATDAQGNTAICSFQVMVVDTEKPEFDADIVMPADITVECDAVPAPFVLTNNDVNDNCTTPANLKLDYNQQSTQGNNPALCSYYNYTLTRTWSVTDCAGNTLVHTQVITVEDTTDPEAKCKNLTVTLDKFGLATITPDQINNGSTDNCAAPQFLTYTVDPDSFTCANLGANTVTLTVTDPCGNASTCTAIVTVVEGIGKCTPVFDLNRSLLSDCLDNATNLDNGQFEDRLQIHALAGQTWTIAGSVGFYTTTSPNPPAAPIPLANGTALVMGNLDGVDNDGDGLVDEADEMVLYTLRGRHIDGLGYSITLTNNLGQLLTITNKSYYPTPVFLNLDGPFCLSTPPFQIEVGENYGAAGVVTEILVNGVATNTFNAAQLGIGFHTVKATFDAGTAQPFVTVNGAVVSGSDAEALADPGCEQMITQTVQVVGTPTTIVCNDLIYISLDSTCRYELNADDVLEGTYYCFDDYKVELDRTPPLGNGPWEPGILTAADIGKTLVYRVTHQIQGNLCWGEIQVEDKLAPALTCPADITVACSESTDTAHTGNVVIKDCSNTTVQVDDDFTDFGSCSDPKGELVRTWIVTDKWGNQSSCTQTITIAPFDLDDVEFPADANVDCEEANSNPDVTQPDATGTPTINGESVIGSVLCNAKVNYTDEYFDGCEGMYVILRTWKVLSSCMPIGPDNPREHTQRINVNDATGPHFDCPDDITVSTNPGTCCATAPLPGVIVSEGCSRIVSLEAKVTGMDQYSGNFVTFTVPGSLADFAGNNYWIPDTLAVFGMTQCLNRGTYTVKYTAEDACGNVSDCEFELTVEDLVPPVAACDEFTQVSLGSDGNILVNATTFDDGSYDQCDLVTFKVRLMDDGPCDTDTLPDLFDDTVPFCCEDIGDTVTVILRVYDVAMPSGKVAIDTAEERANDCMVQVFIEDKIKPVCVPPAHVTVSCENFDPSFWAHGANATGMDNCCLDTITQTVNYGQFDTICNRGTIVRTFRAFDCFGLSSQCTQRIVVNDKQDYYIKFPDDVLITFCDSTGLYGEPTFFGEDCELVAISHQDDIFTVVPDACFKIERTWRIINWCTYNPDAPCVTVPNPEPNATINAAANRPGPTVSPAGTPAPWNPTVVSIQPGQAPTNYSTFWSTTANCFTYKQIIKVVDTQDPVVTNCPAGPFVVDDLSENDDELYNSINFFDPVVESNDLCEAESELTITAGDACSKADLNFSYLLFLDMNQDGTMETVVSSNNPPPFNTINVGNAGNPNYTGGTPVAFDQRPVPAGQKYRFNIDVVRSGTTATAKVVWDWQQQQANLNDNILQGVTPQLPYGKHKIKWFVSDNCGNETVCEYLIEVKDGKGPTVVCQYGLSVNIMPTKTITLTLGDFLNFASDNCTPADKLVFSMRRAGAGTGFPVDAQGNPVTTVTFDCSLLDTQYVEIWAIDLAGNADFCVGFVDVQDPNNFCGPTPNNATVAGALMTEMDEGVQDANVELEGQTLQSAAFSYTDMTDQSGAFAFTNMVPYLSNYTLTPTKDDNPLNGVSTYDLVLISRHILGLDPLDSPYKMIAADANKSGSITTFDIVELRKLILGIYTELPNNTSWRFVDETFVFPNPNNPFTTQFPETKSVAVAQLSTLDEYFVGVKVGDVNGSVLPNNLVSADDRTGGQFFIDAQDRTVAAGEEFTVQFSTADKALGYQFTMNLKGLEVLNVLPGANMTKDNFGVFADAITASVNGDEMGAFAVTFRALRNGRLSELLSASSRITRAEAYKLNAERLDVAFRFDGQTVSGVGFEVYQNIPNPWLNKTQIGFHLPRAAEVTLTVFDETGRMLFRQTGDFAAGYNTFVLDRSLISKTGVLYYRVETATDSAVKTMIQTE